MGRLVWVCASAALVVACTRREWPEEDGDRLFDEEIEAREAFAASSIALAGTVLTFDGEPLQGARVRVNDAETTSAANGTWRIEGLPRHNAMVAIEAEGFRPHVTPAWLFRPLALDEVALPPIGLRPRVEGSVRFLFGGDMAFGRRYLDPDEATPWDEMPPDHPDAVIQVSDPYPGTARAIEAIQPYLDAADVVVGNLESVVTERPDTPHPTKAFVYFTLPGSLDALVDAGLTYVSLGNNHTYDYLAPGLQDTMDHVEAAGLGFSGLGFTPDAAWAPYRAQWGGQPFSMISASTITGSEHAIGYLANVTQGGAADLTDTTRLRAVVQGEADAGYTPIAQWHLGNEYAHIPNDYSLDRMREAIDAGARLVVAHHTHVAQGFGTHEGVPIAYCLGNFFFDQDRLETMTGLLLQAELVDGEVVDLQALPVQLEQYLSRPISGELASNALRRWAEFSDTDTTPVGDRLHVRPPAATRDREVEVQVQVPVSGFAVIDLRTHQHETESLVWARGDVEARIGRDLMFMGTMEDVDVDDDALEVAHWDVSSPYRFPCLAGAHRGAVGLCSVRNDENTSPVVIAFRNRIRVWGDALDTPNKDLTVFGMVKGENAGPVRVAVRYYASEGDASFGEENALGREGGTYDWAPFARDLSMPPDRPGATRATNPRALRVFLHHYPPARGEGWAAFDDLAVISWEERLDLVTGAAIATPHARDFLRVEASPGTHTLTLAFRQAVRYTTSQEE